MSAVKKRRPKSTAKLALVHSVSEPLEDPRPIERVVKKIKSAAERRAADAVAHAEQLTRHAAEVEKVRLRYLQELRDLAVEVTPTEKRELIAACITVLADKDVRVLPEEIELAVKKQPWLPAESVPGRTRRRMIRA